MTEPAFAACNTLLLFLEHPVPSGLLSAFTDVVYEKALADLWFLQKSVYAGLLLELPPNHCSGKPSLRSCQTISMHKSTICKLRFYTSATNVTFALLSNTL